MMLTLCLMPLNIEDSVGTKVLPPVEKTKNFLKKSHPAV